MHATDCMNVLLMSSELEPAICRHDATLVSTCIMHACMHVADARVCMHTGTRAFDCKSQDADDVP